MHRKLVVITTMALDAVAPVPPPVRRCLDFSNIIVAKKKCGRYRKRAPPVRRRLNFSNIIVAKKFPHYRKLFQLGLTLESNNRKNNDN